MNNEWLSMPDAAAFLGIPYIKLYRMARQGKIKHLLDPNKRFTFAMEDLLEFQSKYPMFKKPETVQENI